MSEYAQTSFIGGMNLLSDDTRLQANQYRAGFNLRNRYDVLDEINDSTLDLSAPYGKKQAIVTFGNYIVLFVGGLGYYRYYTDPTWTKITGFLMSTTAPRYWTVAVPVATTLYGRQLSTTTAGNQLSQITNVQSVASAFAGNLPGLLVQDNINQPVFLFVDGGNHVQCRTTQNYLQWNAVYDPVTFNLLTDSREYVPIGNAMAWVDGKLYVTSKDFNSIYHSVSGRPLDFVVNVNVDGSKGGDATTTSYSVGIGGISTLRATQDGSLFVGAGGSNFMVSKNMNPNAPTLFGEYTFVRKFLFEATCLNDRCIIDSLGDTRFIDLTGVRSFNAIEQVQNEGRNAPWTIQVASAFKGIIQDTAAAILYDNYELYAVTTTYGNVILVYDTINSCWSSFDTSQTNGKKIKQFAKIELGVLRLFAITEDDQLYTLYNDSTYSTAQVVTPSATSRETSNTNAEIKVSEFHCILNRMRQDTNISITFMINNRISTLQPTLSKTIKYSPPNSPYTGSVIIPDADSMLINMFFTAANCEQGWKTSVIIEWNGGSSLTQYSIVMNEQTPMNPLKTQVLAQ